MVESTLYGNDEFKMDMWTHQSQWDTRSHSGTTDKLCLIGLNMEGCTPGVLLDIFPISEAYIKPKIEATVNDTEPRDGVRPLWISILP